MSFPISFDVADFVVHARGADGFVKVDGCTWYMSIIVYVCSVLVNFDNEPRGDRPGRGAARGCCGVRWGSEGVRHGAKGRGRLRRSECATTCSYFRVQRRPAATRGKPGNKSLRREMITILQAYNVHFRQKVINANSVP